MATLKEMMAVWLATKDPDEIYQWEDANNCACGQFARASNKEHTWSDRYAVNPGEEQRQWQELDLIASGADKQRTFGNARRQEWTFGKMLERIKETA